MRTLYLLLSAAYHVKLCLATNLRNLVVVFASSASASSHAAETGATQVLVFVGVLFHEALGEGWVLGAVLGEEVSLRFLLVGLEFFGGALFVDEDIIKRRLAPSSLLTLEQIMVVRHPSRLRAKVRSRTRISQSPLFCLLRHKWRLRIHIIIFLRWLRCL